MASGDTIGIAMLDDLTALAPVESGLIATQEHSSGSMFILATRDSYNRVIAGLCQAYGHIAIGDALIKSDDIHGIYGNYKLATLKDWLDLVGYVADKALVYTAESIGASTLESSSTASRAYTIGDYFLVKYTFAGGGSSALGYSGTSYSLCRAITNIAQGDTLYGYGENQNYESVTLESEIKPLNAAQLPIITKQPEDANAPVGATATFSVSVDGAGPFTYQWQRKSPGDAWANSGATGNTTNTLTVTLNQSNASGGFLYRCAVTNANGTVYSKEAALNLFSPAAEEFDPGGTYPVGKYCMYDRKLYRCTTAHEGAWDASHFTAVSVGGDIVNYLPTLFAPKTKDFVIQNGASKSFNIANSSRMLVIFASANEKKNAIYTVVATSSGSVMVREFAPNDEDGSDLTVTFSRNNLTVANAATGSMVSLYAQVFNGDITEITT